MSYDPKTLRPALSEENGGAWLQVLWSVHELELHMALVTRTQQVFIHIKYFGCLSNDTTMYNCLIISFDGSGMMKNNNLSLKIVY